MEQTEVLFNPKILLPETFLFAMTLIMVVVAIIRPKTNPILAGYIVMTVLAVTMILVATTEYGSAYGDLFINEYSSPFFKFIFIGMGFCAAGIWAYESANYSSNSIFQLALLQLSILAMMFLSMSGNLISMFATMELCAIPLVMIAAFQNGNAHSKAAQKFLLAMLFSSLLILFGLAFLFGLSGAVNLLQMKLQIAIVHLTQREIGVIILLSVAAILSGLMMKAALPPFHKWIKELHQTLPLSVTAFISVALVAAVLAFFAKIFINGLFAFHGPEMNPNDWGRLVSLVAFASIVFGTVQLMRQKEIISLLYYSNMIQVGFILTGMVSMNQLGLQSAAFYLVAFLFAAAGIYSITALLKNSSNATKLTDLRGMYHSSKLTAIFLVVSIMSLAGLPLTAGFVAKFSVIEAAFAMGMVDKMFHWMFLLTATAAICAAIAFIKFAKISYSLFVTSENILSPIKIPVPVLIVLIITALGTVFFGVLPDPLLDYASKLPLAFGFMAE